jgi:hypothetical protein
MTMYVNKYKKNIVVFISLVCRSANFFPIQQNKYIGVVTYLLTLSKNIAVNWKVDTCI